MNANTQTLFDELHGYAMNVHEETGWPLEKAWRHVLDFHDYKVKAVGKELALQEVRDQKRRELENPQEVIMSLAHREYEKNLSEPKVKMFSALLQNNPQLNARYDAKVLGRNLKSFEAKRRYEADMIEHAHAYMKEHPEATRLQAFQAAEREVRNAGRQYQDDSGVEIVGPETEPEEMNMEPGSAYQRLGSIVIPLMGKGDMAAAVRYANSHPRLSQQAASEWLIRQGQAKAEMLGVSGLRSQVNPMGQSMVLGENPAVRPMVNRGATTPEALRTLYLLKKNAA